VLGPAPVQDFPPILLGGSVPAARRRAVELGDGFLFSRTEPGQMRPVIEELRQLAMQAGKPAFTVGAVMSVAVGGERELDEAVRHVRRGYTTDAGSRLAIPPERLITHGPPERIAEVVAAYAAAGLDFLVLAPVVPALRQVELLAEHVLPRYR
jgi:alkanesulfonate monooxygenase SsuD/methylene tetrahydromethanopterin reductase-like flavin-dependent oxidoreductase (luciferase family)